MEPGEAQTQLHQTQLQWEGEIHWGPRPSEISYFLYQNQGNWLYWEMCGVQGGILKFLSLSSLFAEL